MADIEEVDYMSDDFLATCSSQDVRPGLVKSHSQQRQIEMEKKKNLNKKRSIKEIEAENREEGLKQTLTQENKGFAMLQKMGYKTGNSLGKSNTGITEPLEISLKTDRTGLGRETLIKEIAERKLKRLREAQSSVNFDKYRKHVAQKLEDRRDEADFRKSRRICAELDAKKEIGEPVEKWFWPDEPKHESENEEEEEEEEEDVDDELSVQEKLEFLTKYLRETHLYCIWCGALFDDEKDLRDNCPGYSRDDH